LPSLHVNDKAPLFDATTDSSEHFTLSEQIGKTNVVLYFYPKDFTAGCTKESCEFRDNWEKILSLGATVIGVSSDSVESHKAFKQEHVLPFTLVSDQKHEIRRMYGVEGHFFIPPRVTFVIDKQGVIRDIFSSQLNMSKHIENSLRVLEQIEGKKEVQPSTATEEKGGYRS
jgi:peroxiredoxin Q/BCP